MQRQWDIHGDIYRVPFDMNADWLKLIDFAPFQNYDLASQANLYWIKWELYPPTTGVLLPGVPFH